MELYRIQISEVHQTYPSDGKSIWACSECLGHPISKKNGAKGGIFGRVIQGIQFLTTLCKIDYKPLLTTLQTIVDYTLQNRL